MFIHSVSNLVVTKVFSANRLLNSPVGITTNRENREGWAIVLKMEGKTIYTVEGEPVVADSLHPLILSKGSTYSWKCVEPGECLIVEFEADARLSRFESVEVKDNSVIVNAFSKIEKSLDAKKSYYNAECICYVYEMLLFLLKSAKKEPSHPKINDKLQPAITYITENYFDGNITNDFLANLCGTSTVYFRKSFETAYGTSPIKYLHDFRINKAKAMLRSDYDSIEQVAFSIGYNSIYHFSKMFKHYTGKSPTEYSRQHRN